MKQTITVTAAADDRVAIHVPDDVNSQLAMTRTGMTLTIPDAAAVDLHAKLRGVVRSGNEIDPAETPITRGVESPTETR